MDKGREIFMLRCLDLAARARSHGKPAVGSVVVRNGKIIGEGMEGDADYPRILAHAEVIAISNALRITNAGNLSDCVLYTTVEPCFMCSYLIRQMKIKEIIFGTTTPETGGASSEFPFLKATNIKKWGKPPIVIAGVLKEECEAILEDKK